MVISKNCEICSEIKFEIENVDFVRQKLWVENFGSKILSDFKLNKFLIILKLNYNRGQFYKNILNFGYFKKFWILQLNKVWKIKCWLFALQILSEFKIK